MISFSLSHSFNLSALAKDITGKVQKHPTLAFKDFVGQLDDEAIGEDQVAQGLDMEQVFHFLAGLTVLTQDRIDYGSRTGDACLAMHQHLGFGRQLTGKVENALYVHQTRCVRMVENAGIVEKTEKMLSPWRDSFDQFTACRVVKATLVPNRNHMAPVLTLLIGQFTDTANGQVDFHRVQVAYEQLFKAVDDRWPKAK